MGRDEPVVRDIMVRDVHTILPEAPAIRAAQIMVRYQVRHVLVVDTVDGVVGVISQRQILKHFSPWRGNTNGATEDHGTPLHLCAREVMTRCPITVAPSTAIREAAGLMASNKIGCLPVIEGRKRLVGIVTSVDVLRFAAANEFPEPEEDFEVFSPPAFLNKDRALTLPAGYFPDSSVEEGMLAVLAYAPKSKRIGVRFFRRGEHREESLGARPVTTTNKYLVIPAGDFLDHHQLNIRGPLEVTRNERTGYVVLSPVLSPSFRMPADEVES